MGLFSQKPDPHEPLVAKRRRELRGWWYAGGFIMLLFTAVVGIGTWSSLDALQRGGGVNMTANIVLIIFGWVIYLFMLSLIFRMIRHQFRQLREAQRGAGI
jgi:heme/copper-type cytochrome/quinol oxidase subunit 2